jgi:hypothetical protein
MRERRFEQQRRNLFRHSNLLEQREFPRKDGWEGLSPKKQNNYFGNGRCPISFPPDTRETEEPVDCCEGGQHRLLLWLGKPICDGGHLCFDFSQSATLGQFLLRLCRACPTSPKDVLLGCKTADRLSREETTTANDQKLLDSFPKKSSHSLSKTGWKTPQKTTPFPTGY